MQQAIPQQARDEGSLLLFSSISLNDGYRDIAKINVLGQQVALSVALRDQMPSAVVVVDGRNARAGGLDHTLSQRIQLIRCRPATERRLDQPVPGVIRKALLR